LQEHITSFWSTVAAGYEAHGGNVPARDSQEYAAWVRAITELLPEAPSDVLDVGTGTGFAALIAAECGHRLTGIDLAEPMLVEARAAAKRRGLHITFSRDDAVAPSLAEHSFDAVLSRHLIWTLRQPLDALRAWRSLLRPGGRVVAIDGFWFSSRDDVPPGLFESLYDRDTRQELPGWRYFQTSPIVTLFENAGFERVQTRLLHEVHDLAERPPSDQPWYALVGFLGG